MKPVKEKKEREPDFGLNQDFGREDFIKKINRVMDAISMKEELLTNERDNTNSRTGSRENYRSDYDVIDAQVTMIKKIYSLMTGYFIYDHVCQSCHGRGFAYKYEHEQNCDGGCDGELCPVKTKDRCGPCAGTGKVHPQAI